MKIRQLETILYNIPLKGTRGDAIQKVSHIELIMVKVFDQQGATGTGSSYTIGTGGTSVKEFVEAELRDLVIGEDPNSVERIWQKMWWATHWVTRGGIAMLAMAAVDIALWDLIGRARKIPLYQLLGGHRDKVPVYGSDGGWLDWDISQLKDSAREFVNRGFKAIKIKVGKDNPTEDIERVKAVREAVGKDVRLMVDANQKWSCKEAIHMGKALEQFDIFWLEEPTIPDDVAGHQKVARNLNIPLALGESLYTKYDFKEYLLYGGVEIVQPDVARVGGITEWIKIAHMAHCFNLPVAPHIMPDIHLPLVAAIPNGLYVEYMPWLDEVLTDPLSPVNGQLNVRTVPGHGIPFDEEKLKRFRAK